jgi:peptidoglycan/xylan/chitin deacetylase (PgdA/CDA1 family)
LSAPLDPPRAATAWPWPPLLRASVGLHAAAAAATAAMPALWPWSAAALAANHALITGAGLLPRCDWLGPNWRRLPATPGPAAIALTLDDGPDPDVTPAVLDLLAEHGLRASFFCIAERARVQPALLRRIVAAGHDVQNHSAHHRHHFSLMGPRALAEEVGRAQAILGEITGHAPHCFRAPAGLRNPFLDPVLHRLGLHLVSWTRRGFDTRERDAARVLARLTRGLAARDILLLHDGHAAASAADGRPLVLAVLPALARALAAAGLGTVPLGTALPPRHEPRATGPAAAPLQAHEL